MNSVFQSTTSGAVNQPTFLVRVTSDIPTTLVPRGQNVQEHGMATVVGGTFIRQ